jgi:DNA-binding winged helix-turn-helix (wHTH) protein
MRLRFGECVLDTELRQLTRKERPILLSPKAFSLLAALAERRPRAVAHAELRRLVWPDALVGGTSLARLLNEVRCAIGDQAEEPRFIRTVHRFGYAFCGSAVEEAGRPEPPPPAYALRWGDRLIGLRPGENIIGRASDAAVSISMAEVSRRHARIVVDEGRATLEDLGSKHGTRVGQRRVEGPVELHHGDEIVVGPVLLIFRDSSDEEPTL